MYTSILLVAMAGTAAPSAARAPDWKPDYASAVREGKLAHKPLAVLVGRGADGWGQVSETDRLGADVRGLLGEHYVCVYVDRDTKEGQKLAAELELTAEGPGLVISDYSGEVMAFRHAGKLSTDDMTRYLRTYSDPNRVVTQTDSHGSDRTSYYPPGYGFPAPAGYGYPGPVVPYFGGRSSGC
jgi:hypothetical protein